MLAKSKTGVPDRIQRYSRSDRARVFELLRVARAAGFARPLIDQWNWKYDDNPFNREAECYRRAHRDELLRIREQYSPEVLQKWDVRSEDDLPEREDDPLILVAKTRAGEVIAMLGAVPVRFLVGGAKEWASVTCDWFVRPEHRDNQLSMRLSMRLASERVLRFTWGSQTSGIARTRWLAANSPARQPFRALPSNRVQLTPLAKPIDWGYLAHRKTGRRWFAAGAAVAGSLIRPVERLIHRPKPVAGVTIVELTEFDQRFDQLWSRVQGDYAVVAIRDSRYLRWRFDARPDATYLRLAALRGSDLVGYLVCRTATESDGATIGYLVDFLIENRSTDLFSLLLWHAEQNLLRHRVKAIVCTVASSPFREQLMRSGYHKFESGRAPGYFSSAVNSTDPALLRFADLRQWYFTMSDGDLELTS